MKYILVKDRRRRLLTYFFERRTLLFRSLIENNKLAPSLRINAYKARITFPRDSSIVRSRNRCTLTGRSRAIDRKFGRSRLRFRKLASQGLLSGVKKAIWLVFCRIPFSQMK